jgi:KDO2-lipid IV(A) lauroyltransferase
MREGTGALLDNLRTVRPDASAPERRRLALLTYRSYAHDFIDFIRGLSMTRSELEPLIARFDADRLGALLAEGRGVVLVTGHFGNWELGGIVIRLLGGFPLTVVGKPEPSPMVNQWRQRIRERGHRHHRDRPHLETALPIRRHLSANRIVAMLLDRRRARPVEVTFFGRPALFVRSPAMIA